MRNGEFALRFLNYGYKNTDIADFEVSFKGSKEKFDNWKHFIEEHKQELKRYNAEIKTRKPKKEDGLYGIKITVYNNVKLPKTFVINAALVKHFPKENKTVFSGVDKRKVADLCLEHDTPVYLSGEVHQLQEFTNPTPTLLEEMNPTKVVCGMCHKASARRQYANFILMCSREGDERVEGNFVCNACHEKLAAQYHTYVMRYLVPWSKMVTSLECI